jgi:rare lipoprotein A
MTRAFLLLGSLLVIGTAAGFHFDVRPLSGKGASSVEDPHQVGPASWYGPGFHGRQTANGERFDQDAMTMAHRSMKFGTCVRVTRVDTGDSVLVRVNDRGPYVPPRIADLSRGAAAELGMLQRGVADVRLEPVQQADC